MPEVYNGKNEKKIFFALFAFSCELSDLEQKNFFFDFFHFSPSGSFNNGKNSNISWTRIFFHKRFFAADPYYCPLHSDKKWAKSLAPFPRKSQKTSFFNTFSQLLNDPDFFGTKSKRQFSPFILPYLYAKNQNNP